MKFTKLYSLFLLLSCIALVCCKGKTSNDLIVKKWKFTDISGASAFEIPDSVKKALYANATMEFKKDGRFEAISGNGSDVQTGSYSLSADGKTLYNSNEGATVSDTINILELSKDKLIISPKNKDRNGDLKVTMVPK